MKRTLAVGVSAMAAVAVLAGCGSSDGGETKPKFPLSGLQDYENPDQIAADLKEGGLPCGRFEQSSGSRYAAGSADCWISDSGEEEQIILMTFSSETNKDSQVQTYRQIGSIIKSYAFVEGGNWLVNCNMTNLCDKIQGILGGRLEKDPIT